MVFVVFEDHRLPCLVDGEYQNVAADVHPPLACKRKAERLVRVRVLGYLLDLLRYRFQLPGVLLGKLPERPVEVRSDLDVIHSLQSVSLPQLCGAPDPDYRLLLNIQELADVFGPELGFQDDLLVLLGQLVDGLRLVPQPVLGLEDVDDPVGLLVNLHNRLDHINTAYLATSFGGSSLGSLRLRWGAAAED